MNRIAVLILSLFAQASGAETLIAAGDLKAAGLAIEKMNSARIEQNLRAGYAPAAAVRELGLVFTTKADQAYLQTLLGSKTDAERPVKFRALERVKNGYRVTSPDGHVAQFGVNQKTHRATVNGRDLPAVSAGAEAYFTALQKELGTAKFARLNLLSLFGPETAAAFLSSVPIGLLVIGGLLALCGVIGVSGSTYSTIKAVTVAEYLDRMTKLCEMERTSSRVKFDDSESGKFLKLMSAQNVLDGTSGVPAADCTATVDRLFVKNEKMMTANRKLTRGEVAEACVNAAAFSSCVKDYRNRDATLTAPAPGKPGSTTAPGVAQ